jgi:prepilin-type N-terminal cleavage/methylation domain-containing protein
MRPELHVADDDEHGFTLVEVLVTIALISIAFISILSAVAAMITAGAENTNAATSLTTARNLAAFMQSQTYIPCGAAGAAATAYNTQEINALAPNGFVPPSGYIASVSAVEAWNGLTSPVAFGPTDGSCPTDHGLERLTLTVQPAPSQLGTVATRTITILKRH